MMQSFDGLWETNRDTIRGLLVYLARDIDLADDLLQETYLRARAKFNTYEGGDARAWLAAVARNVAFAHLRKASVKSEVPLEHDYAGAEAASMDSQIEMMLVRDALANLAPPMRQALIMKHYGGFSYPEIAARLACPVGTAKSRVWSAVRQLRQALGIPLEAQMAGKCPELKLLEYAYGALRGKEKGAVESHLAACKECAMQLDSVRGVIGHLEAARDGLVCVDVTEIHEDDSSSTYSSGRIDNPDGKAARTHSLDSMDYHEWQGISVDGEPVEFRVEESPYADMKRYSFDLAKPIPPGGSAVTLGVYKTKPGVGAAFDIGHGRRVAVPDNSGDDEVDTLLVQMVRLPKGAKLIGSVPIADETREGEKTTLVWRRLITAGEARERPVVVYSLPA